MPRLNRYDRQSPMDYLITAQSSINGLFDFLKSNSINYNGRDFYNRKDWDIKITQRTNTSTIAASNELETSASFQKEYGPITTTIDVLYNYGNLYNWYVISGGTISPSGWTVPSDTDFTTLETYLSSNVGGKLKSTKITTTGNPVGWKTPNTGAIDGLNFNALGAGLRTGGGFNSLGGDTFFWTSTPVAPVASFFRVISFSSPSMNKSANNNTQGNSIRCMRLATPTETGYTDGTYCEDVQDIDGNWYKTVKIGTQIWFAQNLRTTKYNDGTDIPNVSGNTEWNSLTTGAYCTYDNVSLSTYEDPTYYYSTTQTTYTKGFSKSFDIKTE